MLVGRPGFLTDAGIDLASVAGAIARLEGEGHTVVAVSHGESPLGVLALADTARPQAGKTVARLRAEGLTPVVTGDNPRADRHVAEHLGITEVRAEVLPDGQAGLVREIQADGAKVAMAGDGIKRTPPHGCRPTSASPWC